MNELIKKSIKNNLGKRVLIFLKNNFRYKGKLTNADEKYLEILDDKSNHYQIILIMEIKQIEVLDETYRR